MTNYRALWSLLMQSSHLGSLPNLNESHSSLDHDNTYMKLLNDYPSGFSEIEVKPIQEYTLVHYVKATQPLLSGNREKVYFKTSYVIFIVITAYSLSDIIIEVQLCRQIQTCRSNLHIAPSWPDTNQHDIESVRLMISATLCQD